MFQQPSQPQAPQARVGGDENPSKCATMRFVQGSLSQNQGPEESPKLNHKKPRTRKVKVTSLISFILVGLEVVALKIPFS
jgi:hypothetical protein